MLKKMSSNVVVITGASSGIGKATALAFARKGSTVVVAARREEALQETARLCEQAGGAALVVPTDMTNAKAVQHLANQTLTRFGRIDVWVNNHGVTLFAPFDEAPIESYQRVIETDLMGTIYGARAVLPIFREQGYGTLINMGSMVSRLSEPYASSYVIAKHGVRALGMSLRQEIALGRYKHIHICTVMPATIDTPFFQHAGNVTGRAVKAMPPVSSAERVARAIVNLARWPRREVFVGNAARLLWYQSLLVPGLTERLMAHLTDRWHLDQEKEAPSTSGNLFNPLPEGTAISGGWSKTGSRQKTEGEMNLPRRVLSFAGPLSVLFAVLWLTKRIL